MRAKSSEMRMDWFEVSSDPKGARTGAARGTAILSAGQLVQIIIKVVATFILSRLLTPQDFGLVAMATTVTLFATLFTDLGLSTATIRAPKLKPSVVATLLHANALAGIALGLLCVLLAPLFADFFGDQRITGLICALAVTLPINAVAAQHLALLTRAGQWIQLQVVAIVPQGLGLVLAIASVLLGAGYWALAVQAIVASAAATALIWMYCDWRPRPKTDWRGALADLNLGSKVAGFGLINWLHRQGDNMLIGRYWGAQSLGFYSRAYTLYMLPMTLFSGPLRTVCLPMLSRAQNDPESWRNGVVDVMAISTMTGAFFSVVLTVSAKPIVLLLLGDQWVFSVEIFQILSLSYLVASPSNMFGTILVSNGRAGVLLLSGAINCSILFVMYILALPYGAEGVALAYSVTLTALFTPTLWLVLKGTPVRFATMLRQLVPLMLAGGAALLLSHFAVFESGYGIVADLALALAFSTAIFVGTMSLPLLLDPAQTRIKAQTAAAVRYVSAACRAALKK